MTVADAYLMFRPNARVAVSNNKSYKRRNLNGKFGTVVENQASYYGKIVVDLDTESNPLGRMGYFYFKPTELELINDENDILEENNMENAINYFNTVKVKYLDNDRPNAQVYANFDTYLTVGDMCVVKSLNHGLGLAIVVEIIDKNDVPLPREIVAKVDTQDYDHRVAARKDAAKLKAKMQERAKQLQDIALYQMLAEKDPEMKELLERFQTVPQY